MCTPILVHSVMKIKITAPTQLPGPTVVIEICQLIALGIVGQPGLAQWRRVSRFWDRVRRVVVYGVGSVQTRRPDVARSLPLEGVPFFAAGIGFRRLDIHPSIPVVLVVTIVLARGTVSTLSGSGWREGSVSSLGGALASAQVFSCSIIERGLRWGCRIPSRKVLAEDVVLILTPIAAEPPVFDLVAH